MEEDATNYHETNPFNRTHQPLPLDLKRRVEESHQNPIETHQEEAKIQEKSEEISEPSSSSGNKSHGQLSFSDIEEEEEGRERLKRYRVEVAGRVGVPEIWGQEGLLRDWIDCGDFDDCLVPSGLMPARAALVHEATIPTSSSHII